MQLTKYKKATIVGLALFMAITIIWVFSYILGVFSNKKALNSSKEKNSLKLSDISCGLVNLGNTCYMNAALQAILHCPGLTRCLFYTEKNKIDSLEGVTRTFSQLVFEAMQADTLAPKAFHRDMARINPCFGDYTQQDSAEFITELRNQLHDGLKGRHMKESFVSRLFESQLKSIIKCLECNQLSTTIEKIYDIAIELRQKTPNWLLSNIKRLLNLEDGPETLEECLDLFFSSEKLAGDQMYFCESCKDKKNAEKKLFLAQPTTNVLVIHLKRFQRTHLNSSKISRKVVFSEVLDIGKYVDDHKSPGILYELIGVVVHHGSFNMGHYTAYCLNFLERRWYLFNDEQVVPTTLETVLNAEAYILFYQKKNHSETIKKVDELLKETAEVNLPRTVVSNVFCEDHIEKADISKHLCKHGGYFDLEDKDLLGVSHRCFAALAVGERRPVGVCCSCSVLKHTFQENGTTT
eukprot:GHVN01008140.1.p1 GENE.GHVN01008140.1~~GHVN01008140.1.p1  ORF type:complete len:465 (-),score=35.54 GHVN01008140.1:160-1554(-)